MTLIEFILARIAEDEEIARRSRSTLLIANLDRCKVPDSAERNTFIHHARWEPGRVLAECEAKRRIVEWMGEAILADLALPYADHPDFREEWKE